MKFPMRAEPRKDFFSNSYVRWLLRIIAMLTSVLVVFAVVVAFTLHNLNSLTPALVKEINERTEHETSIERLQFQWSALSPLLRAHGVEVAINDDQKNLRLTAEDVEVAIQLSSVLGGNWKFDSLENLKIGSLRIVNPRLTGSVTATAPAETGVRKADLAKMFALSQKIDEFSVENGAFDLHWDLPRVEVNLTGDFAIDGNVTRDGIEVAGFAKSKLYNETRFDFELVAAADENDAISSELQVEVDALDLNWLLIAGLDRYVPDRARTVLAGTVRGRLTNLDPEHAEWELLAYDPDIIGKVPDVRRANLVVNGWWDSHDARSESGWMEASASLNAVDAAALLDWNPGAFRPKFRRHMSERLSSLHITDVEATVGGSPADFTLDNAEVAVRGEFSGMDFLYGRKLPPILGGAGRFEVRDRKFRAVFEQGSIYGQGVRNVEATIDDIAVADPIMRVEGSLEIEAAQALELFGPDGSSIPGKSALIHGGSGAADMTVVIDVPMRRGKEFEVSGVIEGSGLTMELENETGISDIAGQVTFDRAGLTGGALSGGVYGGAMELEFEGAGGKGSRVFTGTASGDADVAQLAPYIGGQLASLMSGKTDWKAEFELQDNDFQINLESDLNGIGIGLPEPLRKETDIALPTKIAILSRDDKVRDVVIAMREFLDANMEIERTDDVWRLKRGAVGLGGSHPSMPRTGLNIEIDVPKLEYGEWSDFAMMQDESVDSMTVGNLNHVRLNARQVTLASKRPIHDVSALLDKTDNGWQVNLASEEIDGEIRYTRSQSADGRGTLDMRLAKCHLPAAAAQDASEPTDPASLPAINMSCDDMIYGEYRLGRADISGVPTDGGWQVTKAKFEPPAFDLTATGKWLAPDREHRTEIEFRLETDDLGETLSVLGFDDAVSGGVARIDAEFTWDGALTRWSPAVTDGYVTFRVDDGIVTQVDSGALKVVGLLNYRKILSRLTLQFDDVREGFAFDTIKGGTHTIDKGDVTVNDLVINGTSAEILLSGSTDWVHKEHDLKMVVAPKLSKTAPTIIGYIVSLPAGILTYLGQKATNLDETLDQGISYEIKGPWGDAEIKEISPAGACCS